MAKSKRPKSEENEGGVTNNFLALVNRYLNVRDEIQDLYKEQEKLLADILTEEVKPGTVFSFPEEPETKYAIRDNFRDTNIIFRSCAAKRFDIAEVKDLKKGKDPKKGNRTS